MSDAMPWLESCSEFLLNVAWKGTLFLTAAWAVDRLWLQRRLLGADVLWTATLLGLLALPLGAATLPQTMLLVWRTPAAVEISPQETASSPLTPIALPAAPFANHTREGTDQQTTPPELVASTRPTASAPFAWPSPRAVAAVIYLSGCMILLARLAWGVASMTALVKRTTPVLLESWQRAFASTQKQLGVRRSVRLLASEETTIPFTIGWLRPAIVVPADVAAAADEATIDATLLHELTHIARADYPVHLAGKLVEACYWWNPLALLATARLNTVRESICDGYCCWQMGDCERYGHVLLALAGRLAPRRVGGVGLAMARSNRLGKRLETLTALHIAQPMLRTPQRLGTALVAVMIASLSASVTLSAETPAAAMLADAVARLREVEDSIKTLAGSFRSHAEHSYQVSEVTLQRGPQQEREEITTRRLTVMTSDGLASFEWQRDNRSRLESETTSVDTLDGVEKNRFRGRHTSVFNGTVGWSCTTQLADDGTPLRTDGQKFDSSRDLIPPELFPITCVVDQGPQKLSEVLNHENAKAVRTETIDNRPTLVIEIDPIVIESRFRYGLRFWIDVERGVAVRREAWERTNDEASPALLLVMTCSDYQEAAPGIWLPMKAERRTSHIDPDESDRQGSTESFEMQHWRVNADIPAERFAEKFPANATIRQAPTPAPAPAAATVPDEQSRAAKPSPTSRQLKVIVVDETGQPLEGARVRQHHAYIPSGVRRSKIDKVGNYLTDVAGVSTLICEEESTYLSVTASHPRRVPLQAFWNRDPQSTQEEIPKELRFTLKPGATIGGVVRDESGKPIAGAKVEIFNLFTAMPVAAEQMPTLQPAPPSPNNAAETTQPRSAGQPPSIQPMPLPWLAEGETAIVTDGEGRWQATNIPSDEELTPSSKRPMMALPSGAAASPLLLRVSRDGFESHDDTQAFTSFESSGYRSAIGADRDETLKGTPSLTALRRGEAVVVLKATKEDASVDAPDETGAAKTPATPTEAPIDSKVYLDPPKLAYLAWELPPSKDGPQLSRAWNLRGEEADEPLSTGTFELRGKTHRPHVWNWADDTLRLHAQPLVLWFEDGVPFEYRHTMVVVVDAAGRKHSRSQALSKRADKRLISVAAPEKPFAWPAHVDLLITYPIEATQTIKELNTFSDQPLSVAAGVDWVGRVEADGRFASTLIIWRKPGDEDRTSYGATLFAKDGARFSNDAGGVVRTFNDRVERVEWYAGVRPEAIARVKISRQRKTTATIEDVPIRLDLLPKGLTKSASATATPRSEWPKITP